jgi:nucleoside phosphorylase
MTILDLSDSAGHVVRNVDGRLAAVVLTALEVEYRAVREHLTALQVWEHPAGTLFELGTIRGSKVRIALAIAGEGNQSSAVVTERACGAFSPRMVLLVGVAGALHTEVALGDVVVATRIYAYQGGKEDPSGFLVRPRAWDAPHHLEQRARYLTRTSWWRRLLPDVTNCGFRVHFKPVLAGEVVFDSPDSSLAELAYRHYNDAVAVEMESAGVSLAARLNRALPVLTIRGISDRADGAKATCDSAGWPAVAAARAAAFALTLVASVENQAVGTIPDITLTSIPLIRRPRRTAAGRSARAPAQIRGVAASGRPDNWQRHAFVDHDRLFGADRLIENVRHAITSRTGHEVVSLFGEGGVGKTAVAYSAVAEAVAQGAFSRVAWFSPLGRVSAVDSTAQSGSALGGLDVLRELSVQLGFGLGSNRAMRPEHFGNLMNSLRSDERVLAVIDGLEAVENAIAVVQYLRVVGLARPHKLLVTTRWQLRAETVDATEFRLWPLAGADAIALIRHAGAEDRLMRSLNDSVLERVIDVTEGNPFLLKLIIDQYLSSHLPLGVVLDSLRGKPLTDLVRAHLYERSLNELEHRFGTPAAKALLSSFCGKGHIRSLKYEELASVLGVHARVNFPGILVDACRLALVTASGDRSPEGETQRIYVIHNLLHELTCDCHGMASVAP